MKNNFFYNLIKRPYSIVGYLVKSFAAIFPDKLYLSLLYFGKFGHCINWSKPATFNEKLQWLKLYDRNPLYTTLVDKYAVKKWVSEKIGQMYIIPTLGVWNSPEEIDFESLPSQFVLKTTYGGGNKGVYICKDKSQIDRQFVIKKMKKAMRQNLFLATREWPYKNVQRRVLAEKYIEDVSTGELRDYKFFCFDGEVKYLYIASDRNKKDEEVKFDYFDVDFNYLELIQTHPRSGNSFEKPKKFDEMKSIASRLSKGIPQVRVDLYEVSGQVYFGEMTFYHHGGMVPFHPIIWDKIWGDLITLPTDKR